MQICEHTNEELIGVADNCSVLTTQFDKDGAVATALNSSVSAIRELLFYRRLDDRPDSGAKIYIASPGDQPGIARFGEPLPRPFVVAILPYAKWLILESSATRVEDAEAIAKAMTESSERNAALADNFEKLLVAEREKNAKPLASQSAPEGGMAYLPTGMNVLDRGERQKHIASWAVSAFGEAEATSLPQRGIRLLEEAAEAAQSTGVDLAMAEQMMGYVWGRPAGELSQELGGVGITLLALAAAANLSADKEEEREARRVLSAPLSHFTERNAAKNASGFLIAHEDSEESWQAAEAMHQPKP